MKEGKIYNMRTFEQHIFINCQKTDAYDQIAEPLNMIGLQPLLTQIDVLKERKDENNITLRPFYMVETFRWMGLAVFRNKIYAVIHLTKPKDELEIRIYSTLKTELIFKYTFREFNDQMTQVTQTVQFTRVNKLLESIMVNRAKNAQRALLTNLKFRLEKR